MEMNKQYYKWAVNDYDSLLVRTTTRFPTGFEYYKWSYQTDSQGRQKGEWEQFLCLSKRELEPLTKIQAKAFILSGEWPNT